MARNKGTLHGISGMIGPVVVKQYADKTVITAKPDMSKVKRSKKQKSNSSRFTRAVGYARNIMADPAQKSEFAKKLKKGQSVFHAAVSKYMLENP